MGRVKSVFINVYGRQVSESDSVLPTIREKYVRPPLFQRSNWTAP